MRAVWLAIVALVVSLIGQSVPAQNVSLARLKSVSVYVSVSGLTADSARLRTAIELELRKASVPVTETAHAGVVLSLPFLGLANRLNNGTQIGYVFCVTPLFYEAATIARLAHSRHVVVSWYGATRIQTTGLDDLDKSLMEVATDVADEFANAYLAANPKK